jgi:hypothetical protein
VKVLRLQGSVTRYSFQFGRTSMCLAPHLPHFGAAGEQGTSTSSE